MQGPELGPGDGAMHDASGGRRSESTPGVPPTGIVDD